MGGRSRRHLCLVLLLACACAAMSSDAPVATPENADADPALVLRTALAEAERGQVEAALARLAEASLRFPIVADHIDVIRLRWLVEAGDLDAAHALAGEAVARHAASPLHPQVLRTLGDVRAARSDEVGARSAWREALELADSDTDRARLESLLAASHERSGELDEAAAGFLRIWRDQPLSPEAKRADRWLAEREAAGAAPRTTADWRKRADRLFEAYRSEPALEAYQTALAAGPPDRVTRHVRTRIAKCLFRLRRYPEAVAAFAALGKDPEVRFWHARSVGRAGDIPQAIALLEALGRDQSGEGAARAFYYAGLLLEAPEEAERARRNFELTLQHAASRSLEGGAGWALGWAAFREGRHADARGAMLRLAENESHPLDALRPRYWAARALEAGDALAARAELVSIASGYPFSYYGWRAAERLAPDRVTPAPPPLDPGRRTLAPRDLQRVRILAGAGLRAESTREGAALAQTGGGLEDRLEVAQLLLESGAYRQAMRSAAQGLNTVLAQGPRPGHEILWRLAWPRAFEARVTASLGPEAGIPDALVYAIMREESGFQPDAISVVGARGLMQIMPKTGARLAAARGLVPFDPEHLIQPSLNIRLGAGYLEQLSERFGGWTVGAIAGYNAGPEAVERWLGERPLERYEEDAWVETIPYTETRRYVMRVQRSIAAYESLYP